MSLNEQLAVLCGFENDHLGFYWMKDGRYVYQCEGRGVDPLTVWNPTTDLNQLRMCYEATEKDWDEEAKGESFARKFTKCLNRAIVEFTDGKLGRDEFDDFVSSVWVKHPELVAQAILKAKGVS